MNNFKPRLLDGYSSIILDTLRILAALTVFIYHILYHFNCYDTSTDLLSIAAHSGVVVFFVLSGFLIAYTTTQRNRGGIQYLQARFSRLYSIVIPALIITRLAEFAVRHLDDGLYLVYTRGLSFPRYITSGLFMNEIWFTSSAPPINSPLWSLSFEFWYYIIFGLFLYKGHGWKWLIPGIIGCLIAGPKILLMMPIWLFGYLAYRTPRPNITAQKSWLLFFVFIILVALVTAYMPPLPFHMGDAPLIFAGQFFTDWVTGIFVALALWVMPAGELKFQSGVMIKYIRIAADITFPIYVLHYPLIVLYDALTPTPIKEHSQLWLPGITVLIVASVIGIGLEKLRPFWTKLFKDLFSRFSALKSGMDKTAASNP